MVGFCIRVAKGRNVTQPPRAKNKKHEWVIIIYYLSFSHWHIIHNIFYFNILFFTISDKILAY